MIVTIDSDVIEHTRTFLYQLAKLMREQNQQQVSHKSFQLYTTLGRNLEAAERKLGAAREEMLRREALQKLELYGAQQSAHVADAQVAEAEATVAVATAPKVRRKSQMVPRGRKPATQEPPPA